MFELGKINKGVIKLNGSGGWLKKNLYFRGTVRKDRKTKELVKRLRPGDIALIAHRDLDWVAAEGLLRCGVKAVLNIHSFSTGLVPPGALQLLLKKGVYLLENLPESFYEQIREGQTISVNDASVYLHNREVARGDIFNTESCRKMDREALLCSPAVVDDFVVNTLDFAYRERRLITGEFSFPFIRAKFQDRDVVVVIRGKGYHEDLRAIRTFIREKKPVLVGVDGGGDALLEYGYTPDIIIGDMDSVSDAALAKAREVVVHAYTDGRGVPGEERLTRLGIQYQIFAAPGTSEDIAMLMAYEFGAALIVAIGAHSSVVEFLEKGRKGMSSTFLVRLKVGDRLVDAKGVSRLYSSRKAVFLFPVVLMAGLMPLVALTFFSPVVQHLFRLILFRLRLY
jgi:uncharacterized membrane-anchored protein